MLDSARDLLPFLPLVVWLARGIIALWKSEGQARLRRWTSRQVKRAWSWAGSLVRYRILRRETPEARKRRETSEFVADRERRREALRVVCPHVHVEFSEYSKEKIARGESLARVKSLFVACELIRQPTFLTGLPSEIANDLHGNLYNVHFCHACDFGPVSRATAEALTESWQRILEDEPSLHREYIDGTARLMDEVDKLNRQEPVALKYPRNGVRSTLTEDEVQRILKGID